FKAFAPCLHAYYLDTVHKLLKEYPSIRPIYQGTYFVVMTIKFGPRTVSLPHQDFVNLSCGWCSISALGNFNPQKGGHLVL
ncbi:hypothetical protein BYT27DRAFT_7067130, partial [Phlegmacium glaucopus]